MIIASFRTVPLLLFSLLFSYVSHHIMLSRCCNLTTLPLPFPLSLNSLDREGVRLLSPCGSQFTSKTSLQVPLNRAEDTKLQEEFDEDLVLCVVSF